VDTFGNTSGESSIRSCRMARRFLTWVIVILLVVTGIIALSHW